jgi:hypothetical protein
VAGRQERREALRGDERARELVQARELRDLVTGLAAEDPGDERRGRILQHAEAEPVAAAVHGREQRPEHVAHHARKTLIHLHVNDVVEDTRERLDGAHPLGQREHVRVAVEFARLPGQGLVDEERGPLEIQGVRAGAEPRERVVESDEEPMDRGERCVRGRKWEHAVQ